MTKEQIQEIRLAAIKQQAHQILTTDDGGNKATNKSIHSKTA